MKPLRILHVVPTYEPAFHTGGVVRSTSQLCRALIALGAEVTVYTTNCDGARLMDVPREAVDVGGVVVRYFPVTRAGGFRFAPALGQACQQSVKTYDVVHLTSFWCYPGLAGGRAARRNSVPYVMSPRGTLMNPVLRQRGYLKKMAYLYTMERANLVHAQAMHFTAGPELADTTVFGCCNKGFVVPNMVDVQEFSSCPSSGEARQALDIPGDSLVITYLGRLHKRKGIDVLLRGFASFAMDVPQGVLCIAGPDGGQEATLRALAEELGVAKRVRFLGYLGMEAKKTLLAASDLSALVSYPGDNFGQSVVEGLAAGVPALVSEHVCIASDLASSGVAGVVPVRAEGIRDWLLRFAASSEVRDGMASKTRHTAAKLYSPDAVATQMLEHYKQLVCAEGQP